MNNNEKKPTNQGQRTVAREGALTQGVTRPRVGADRCQLAVAVCDLSSSMGGAKIDALRAALTALVRELGDPRSRDAFSVAVVAYGDRAAVHMAARKAAAVDPSDLVMQAGALGSQTNIRDGLAEALTLLRNAGPDHGAQRPIVLLMTDGQHNVGEGPEAVAAELKTRADLVCVGFGDADMALLERLANTPAHAVRADSATDLRRYFVTVATTMAAAGRTGQTAAALLGQSQVLRG